MPKVSPDAAMLLAATGRPPRTKAQGRPKGALPSPISIISALGVLAIVLLGSVACINAVLMAVLG